MQDKLIRLYNNINNLCAFFGVEDYSKDEIKFFWKELDKREDEVAYIVFRSPERVHEYRYGRKMSRKTRVCFMRNIRRSLMVEIIIKKGSEMPKPSREYIKAMEKKGYAYATRREFEEVASKAKLCDKKERIEKIRRDFKDAVDQVKHGRSYAREMIEKAERGKK